ncbi:tRNA 5-methoxyuridine(34)/uridine 5-oxyacetic acid(34) synthase CmoB [Candidatus Thioglobus sp.]|uniref:tRNA 5-methoxyuridine(34)/uridine 5-oxyacetic acid(34) synthase CmoB n=1 Tax=Candidatus Thioglobus sp. TaxID=2026721 RepID=UPI003D09A653
MLKEFKKHCDSTSLSAVCTQLTELSNQAFCVNNGNIPKWQSALDDVQNTQPGKLSFKPPYIAIDTKADVSGLTRSLKKLMPWRKGPYQIGALQLNSEWRGDMKWDRVKNHLRPLNGKTVLDVGCGNGYFTYLMSLAGAKIALGVEPFLLFNYQFQAIRSLIKEPIKAFVLPLKLEQLPAQPLFDTVFSMGVLYHQKDHKLHLQQLMDVMKNDAELVLETLIIDQQHGDQIIPEDRYARMRNVWRLPSTNTLQSWLEAAGFKHIKLVDVTKTTPEEQRATHWIGDNTQSIKDFLDPENNNLTIEGLPAPKRAIFICQK